MIIMSHELKLRSDCGKERVIRSAAHEFIMRGEVAIDEAGPLIQRELDKLDIGVRQILDRLEPDLEVPNEETNIDLIAV